MGCPHCKIIGSNLEMDKGRTLTKRVDDNKMNDDVQDLTLERRHRRAICVKKGSNKKTRHF